MKVILLFVVFFVALAEILAAPVVSCPFGFTLVNKNKCLKAYRILKKHMEAELNCTSVGGTLVTVKNAVENRAVLNFAAKSGVNYIWLGAFCFGNDTSTCYHDDNSGAVSYNNFAPGNPIVDVDYGNCVYTPTFGELLGNWYSTNCEMAGVSFVCEVPTTVSDASCTHNFNGYCYIPSHEMVITTPRTTFSAAQTICRQNNAKLASIHSKQEINFIKSVYNNSGISQITLGASASLPDSFEWVDFTSFDYDNFDPLSKTKGSCLQMDLLERPDSGMWSEINCQVSNYFMCKRQAGMTSKAVEAEELEFTNPKFKMVVKSDLNIMDLSDMSQCNSTIFLAPGVITSLGYPISKPPIAYCFWNVAVLGPYRLGLYFTDFSVMSTVDIFSGNGTQLGSYQFQRLPFSVLAPSNMVTLTHDSTMDAIYNYHGFSCTILPY